MVISVVCAPRANKPSAECIANSGDVKKALGPQNDEDTASGDGEREIPKVQRFHVYLFFPLFGSSLRNLSVCDDDTVNAFTACKCS